MKRIASLLITSLVLVLSACHKPRALTLQEQQVVKALTSNLVPRCVGRYLIDMPADAKMSGAVTMRRARIETQAMSLLAFQKEIADREAILKATKSIDAYPFLYTNTPAWEEHTRYFMHRGTVYDDPGNRIMEGYRWENDARIKVTLEGSDFTDPDQTDDPIVRNMEVKSDVREKAYQVFDLLRNFRGRADDEIPTEPGLCIPGGFLLGKAKAHERLDVDFELPTHPDVYFNLVTDSSLQESESLLQRHRQIDAAVAQTEGGRTIRKGVVALPGWQAEEWLIGGPMIVTEVQGHAFRMEGNSKTGSPLTPFTALRLTNGAPLPNDERLQRASITEAEALALWDAISRTLRPRPNGF